MSEHRSAEPLAPKTQPSQSVPSEWEARDKAPGRPKARARSRSQEAAGVTQRGWRRGFQGRLNGPSNPDYGAGNRSEPDFGRDVGGVSSGKTEGRPKTISSLHIHADKAIRTRQKENNALS